MFIPSFYITNRMLTIGNICKRGHRRDNNGKKSWCIWAANITWIKWQRKINQILTEKGNYKQYQLFMVRRCWDKNLFSWYAYDVVVVIHIKRDYAHISSHKRREEYFQTQVCVFTEFILFLCFYISSVYVNSNQNKVNSSPTNKLAVRHHQRLHL